MTRTQYGVSPWIAAFPKKRRFEGPPFRGADSYPVAIIGGGLAGCFAAYAFAAAGVRVALFEQDRLGVHGAGRGPGVLQGEPTPGYRDLEARYGRKAARALFEASRRAVLDLAKAARRLDIPGVDVHGALRVVRSFDSDEKAVARDLAARRAAGLDAVWLKGPAIVRESGVETARAGVRLREWGVADPYAIVMGFARAAHERGAHVFERTPVRRIRVRQKDVEIDVGRGVVTAETVVVCTGEPTELHRSLKRHVRPDERYVVMTERLPSAIRKQAGAVARVVADVDVPPHVVRWMDEGRIVMAGADQVRPAARAREKVLVQRTGQLMYELSRMYPAISGVMPSHGWDLPMATTADGVMYAGPHRNYPRHLFVWATRHDASHAFLASRIVLRHFLGQSDGTDRYFGFTRGA